eukprot:CAMPEP_0119015168 /NCGR_PEP_ID=MMETSP1176-20130426/10591_1 /TAXON_ID=265551 /ORGANISM="Synedropsis recta cf, Strain CCMP1620" /LENGTH=421 /DNA_ID=CAMNT_0006968437 /DNA_START=48 /DNA_END=1313 /DNA_ORIENTATION=+
MINNVLPLSLTLRLQEKLDADVQYASAFSKLAELEESIPSVVTDSGDEASTAHEALSTIPISVNPIDQFDVEASTNKHTTSGYKDFSRMLAPKVDGASSHLNQPISAKEPTFPVKLHLILSNPEFEEIIAWLPHGRSWRILQQKAFEERVIPLYFRHGRYSSFARQVNGWGFRRVTHGSDYNSYYHEMFLCGMPHLCDKMRRLTSKDATSRKKNEEEPAPDFYALSCTNPLPEAPIAPDVSKSVTTAATGGSLFDMETAALLDHRRRAGLLDRVNLAAGLRSDPLLASMSQGGFQGGLQGGLQGGFQGGFQGGLQGGLQNSLQGLQHLQNVPAEAARLFMMPGQSSSFGVSNNQHQMAAATVAHQQQQQLQQQLQMQFNFPGGADMAQLLAMNNMGSATASGAPGTMQQMSQLMGAGSLKF